MSIMGIFKLAFEELMEEAKEQSNIKDYWLCEELVVKVLNKSCYENQKGVVRRVIDKYERKIEIIRTKNVLRMDQENFRTVIPHIGSLVRLIMVPIVAQIPSYLKSIYLSSVCAY